MMPGRVKQARDYALVEARWAAANELIRADNEMRLMVWCDRVRQADTDRLHHADEEWTRLQRRWHAVTAGRRPVKARPGTPGRGPGRRHAT